MPPPSDEKRAALSLHAAAVSVVAAADAGVYRGLTATSLITVSVEPAILLVSLDALSATAEAVAASGGFTVSLLAREQEFLADRFAGTAPPPPGDWSGIPHEVLSSGRPVLIGALAWFDCGVVATHAVGDHVLLLGRVGDFRAGGGNPLVWWGRQAWTIA